MTTENILSFYNIAKDILLKNTSSNTDLSSLIGFQRLYLSGYDQRIVDYDSINNTGSQLSLYNFVPYRGSINDISKAMKTNLGLLSEEKIYEFDFDVDTPYEETVIGKGNYNEGGIALLPSFVGRSVGEVQSYCNSRGITLTINKVQTNSASLNNQVMTQSLPAGMDVDYISKSKGMTVTVSEYTEKKTEEVPTIPGIPETNKKDDKTKKDDDKKTTEKDTEKETNTTPSTTPEKKEETTTDTTPTTPTVPGTPTEDEKTEE